MSTNNEQLRDLIAKYLHIGTFRKWRCKLIISVQCTKFGGLWSANGEK